MTNQRPTVPAGDAIIYSQTPRGNGDLDVQEADSWDMAEEEARQTTAADLPLADADIESACSSSDASSTGSATSAAASTTTTAATSATGKMTAAVPAAAPANQAKSNPYGFAGFCAFSSIVFIVAGTVFTLMITGGIDTGRTEYPEEIQANKALAGIAYALALVSGSLAVGSAVKAATRNS